MPTATGKTTTKQPAVRPRTTQAAEPASSSTKRASAKKPAGSSARADLYDAKETATAEKAKVSDGGALAKFEKLAKGEVGVAGIKNPPAIHNVKWTPISAFLKTKKLDKLPISALPHLKSTNAGKLGWEEERTILQGDIGNCYQKSSISALAKDDPDLIRQTVREIGSKPNGTKIYAVLVMAEKGTAKANEFQRAAADVKYTVTLPDPKDLTKTLSVTRQSTPVWVTVTDEVPVNDDGELDSSDIVVKGKGRPTEIVLFNFLLEKASAKFHGEYRDLNGGGDAAKAMQEIAGAPALTYDIERKKDPPADIAAATREFDAVLRHHESGGSFVAGTWGNAPDHVTETLAVNDSITHVIKEYPQYNAEGVPYPPGQGFFKPDFQFLDGTGSADHSASGGPSDREGRNSVGDHDFGGHDVFRKFVVRPNPGVMMMEIRNPWGSTRPDKFGDGKTDDDGVLSGHYLQLRTLVGSLSLGGRPTDQRGSLQAVVNPELPKGVKSTFKLVGNETPA